jgi:hypothetical protein
VSGDLGEIFELGTMRRALVSMQRRAKGGGAPEAVEAALTALSNAIEELQVAAEELEIKNEELVSALSELSAEHDGYQQLFELHRGRAASPRRGRLLPLEGADPDLRRTGPAKLEASGAPCRLVNVRGSGYRLEFD